MKIQKITPTGKASSVSASDEIFALAPNRSLIAQAVRVYLSNQRQGTSKVKNRSEVARTTAKWYKQKGTGRARHGSRNAPIFVGGGVAHGPKGLENWQLNLSDKLKKLALKSALSAQIKVIMVSDIPLETEGKTKYAKRFIDVVAKDQEKCLLVYHQPTEIQVWRSFANLKNVVLQSAQALSTYHVAVADKIIFTTAGLADLTQRLSLVADQPKKVLQLVKESAKPAVSAKTQPIKQTAKKPKPKVVKPKTVALKTIAKKSLSLASKKAVSKKAVKISRKVN